MAELFRRKAVLVVGTGGGEGVRIESTVNSKGLVGLDIAYTIERSLKRTPNKASIKVWNLSPSNRARISQLKTVPVTLEVGYTGDTTLIFRGDLRQTTHVRNGADYITTISSGDGEKKLRTARLTRNFPRNTAVNDVIKYVGQQLGVGTGNLNKLVGAGLQKVSSRFRGPLALNGNAGDILARLTHSAGLEYSIQDGNLQILAIGKALAGTAIVLRPSTGLIGSPARGSKGIVKTRSLIIPDFVPGRKIRIESSEVVGDYRCEKCKYIGNTASNDWYIDAELKEL